MTDARLPDWMFQRSPLVTHRRILERLRREDDRMRHERELRSAATDGEMTAGGWWLHRTAEVHPRAIVFPGAYVGPNVVIGAECVLGPGCSIGAPGYGYAPTEEGRQAYRSHVKGVVLEADVHVGANACVDQGRHRATVLRRGCRIDNLVHVAHNVEVGENAMVIAGAMLAGSVRVGAGAWIAPGAQVREWRHVGAGAQVGLGAVVVKDVPAGEVWAGVPARKVRDRIGVRSGSQTTEGTQQHGTEGFGGD